MVWDSVSNAKYSPDLFTLTTSSDWIKHNIGVKEYLNWHLRNIVYNLLHDTRAIMAMNSEEAITDSLLAAQYKWLNSHFDTTQQELGTSSNFKYYNIHAEMLELQNKNLRELFEALTDSNYNKNVPSPITPEQLEKEYRHLLKERIPYYLNDSIYNANEDKLNLKAEIAAWNKLMKQRTTISGMLNGPIKIAFDFGTYNLIFNRLRQLKNEYEAYGSMSGEMEENILSDSCTYEELLAYPNFSVKWNEYLKHFK